MSSVLIIHTIHLCSKQLTYEKAFSIIGLGGVGGYFGFKICKLNETTKQHDISFVARGKTFDIVASKGLTLLSPEHDDSTTKPHRIYQNIENIENPDLILICVKAYDLEAICIQLAKIIKPHTILMPLMNGVDIYERIQSILPNNIILPACVYVASHIKEKGMVEHKGKAGKLFFGSDPKHPDVQVDWIINLFDACKMDFKYTEEVEVEIWTKYIFVASFGLVTAKYNSSIGAVCKNALQKREATEIMKEIQGIATKKAINLPTDIIEQTFDKASKFPADTPTSLQLDIHSNKGKNELELFAGAIIKFGKELQIDTSATERIHQEIMSCISK